MMLAAASAAGGKVLAGIQSALRITRRKFADCENDGVDKPLGFINTTERISRVSEARVLKNPLGLSTSAREIARSTAKLRRRWGCYIDVSCEWPIWVVSNNGGYCWTVPSADPAFGSDGCPTIASIVGQTR
jgi:hypothetical protein